MEKIKHHERKLSIMGKTKATIIENFKESTSGVGYVSGFDDIVPFHGITPMLIKAYFFHV